MSEEKGFDKKNDGLNSRIEKTIRMAEKLRADIAKKRKKVVKGMWGARKLRHGGRRP